MLRETTVENGKVKGIACGWPSITVYYGIPYAAPPVGRLRWAAPEPAASWEGVRDCARPSARCCQLGVTDEFFKHEFYPVEEEMSEDCLYLNIWTPAQSPQEKCPVIFWVHGGGFMTGYGHSAHFDGEHFARQGVILVTINYRLNVFGWMVDKELSAESAKGVSGNYGLLDQIAALKWVRRNIRNFGGDPDNITIAGQSAGAACIHALACSPLVRGDFAKVIFQSGGGIDVLPGMDFPKLEDVEKGMNLKESLGVNSIAEARALPASELLDRWLKTMPSQKIQRMPVVDGYVLKESPYDTVMNSRQAHVPYLIGYTSKEGMPVTPTIEALKGLVKALYKDKADAYLQHCPDMENKFPQYKDALFKEFLQAGVECWAEVLDQQEEQKDPVYIYELTRDLPGDDRGPFHAADLWYVFKTFMRAWRPWEARDYEVAWNMNTCWANFAKNSDPNGEGIPPWYPYTRECPKTYVIGNEKSEMQDVARNARVAFRKQFLLDGKE